MLESLPRKDAPALTFGSATEALFRHAGTSEAAVTMPTARA